MANPITGVAVHDSYGVRIFAVDGLRDNRLFAGVVPAVAGKIISIL